MSFELINVSTIFQIYINKTLRTFVDVICVIYLNDILIYNNDSTQYWQYVRFVLKRLKQYCKKLKIHRNSNEYTESKVDLIVCKTNIKKDLFAFHEITTCNKFIKLQSKNWIESFRIILYNVKIIIKISNFLEINFFINYELNISDVYTCFTF